MNFYVFKLNMQPSVLQEFIEKDELFYLKNNVVELAFQTVFEVKITGSYLQIYFTRNNNNEFYDKYYELKNMTEELYEEYKKILSQYEESGEIYYSKNFLNLNERCGVKRRKLENEYPVLKSAYDIYNDKKIEKEYDLKLINSVGTGITHIQKFYIIDLYLKEMELTPTGMYIDINIFYSKSDELFYIETDDYQEAIGCAHFIEKSINKTRDARNHIGKITINPRYENIEFEGELTEITYTVVYPNGNEPAKRNDILIDSGGKQKTTTIYGPDGKPLNKESLVEEINKEGDKGYLRELIVKGAKIVRTILKVDTLP